MCLLAILYRAIDDSPIILAANREETYARGGLPLDIRQGPVPFIAGLDPAAGGTWLGVSAARLVVAVTNRRKTQVPEQPRSRGLLVRDLLGLRSAREAAQTAARELSKPLYAGCNIVCADRDSLWVVHAGDWLRMRSLAPGYHLLTNDDINDPHDRRIAWALNHLHEAAPRTADEALGNLQRIASHAGPDTPICLHGHDRGTVASTLLSLDQRPRRSRLLHANGPPDRTPYTDRTDLLWELEALAEKEPP
jgi:uncharacterized protein with NRDE domain